MKIDTPIACIGTGYWGKNLVRNFHALGVLFGVCETSPERRTELSAEYPAVGFPGLLEEILADPEVAGVAIATPAETHGDLVRRALLAGKDIFVEKPLCLSIAEGQELVSLASQLGRVPPLPRLHPDPQHPRTDGKEALRVLTVLQACQQRLERGTNGAAPKPSLPPRPYFAHESAFIDEDVEIGEGTTPWPVSHVLKESRIGKHCRIGQNVVIGPNVTIGDNVKIQNNVSVYEGVTLKDHVFCGPSMVFTNVFTPRSEIRRMDELRPTRVRRGASLGTNCTIVCGVTIGQYAFVGAGAVVLKDVPDYALVVGNPGRVVGWMCLCGHRIEFEGEEGAGRCRDCGWAYRKVGQRVSLQ